MTDDRTLLTRADLASIARAEVHRHLDMPYETLLSLANATPANDEPQWRACRGQDVLVDVVVARVGWFRKRVSVEIVTSAWTVEAESDVVIAYMEVSP